MKIENKWNLLYNFPIRILLNKKIIIILTKLKIIKN